MRSRPVDAGEILGENKREEQKEKRAAAYIRRRHQTVEERAFCCRGYTDRTGVGDRTAYTCSAEADNGYNSCGEGLTAYRIGQHCHI